MQLTSNDETDLLMPLYAGVHDRSRWQSFLSRLQRRTGADHASLILGQDDAGIDQALEIVSGLDLTERARQLGLPQMHQSDYLPYPMLRPGRVYSAAELASQDAGARSAHSSLNQRLGVSDWRVIRMRDLEGASAWLSLGRSKGSFSASDGALLIAVAPHLAVALHNFVQTQRLHVRHAASQMALTRAHVGWIALDQHARIVAMDDRMAALIPAAVGDRLRPDNGEARQTLLHMATAAGQSDAIPPRLVTMRDAPRLDMVLTPLPDTPILALTRPVLLALCRLTPDPATAQQACLLAEMFALPQREAELALSIGEGRSIAESAQLLGITQETARNYSKRIYAKIGVRGQTELARRILLSSAMLG
ncbi:helix-turn-helix transcriptional regulator [Sphingobium rhizovicinum]|uniref:Helix-turn-helix transcriptional regulator n=1 Tax=Sphingobium rhizovicinum TaxID=432308 RepID=A0ABV7NJS6_9SPHN